ncbi:UNVERIFIED_CONTAM: hypothetical protein NCL1_26760 [Trichonephila clavipes]
MRNVVSFKNTLKFYICFVLAVSLPRQASSGEFLPSAREVSLSIHTDSDKPHTHVTAILAIFGEFVYHDLAHIAQSAGK